MLFSYEKNIVQTLFLNFSEENQNVEEQNVEENDRKKG